MDKIVFLVMSSPLLLQQLKDGNEKTFKQIMKSYLPRLYSFVNIYIVDKEVTEEIMQDTFMALWNQRRDLDDETCLITYLMVVSRNKCLNYLKKLQLETIPIDSLSESSLYQRSNIYVLEDDSLEKLAMKELTHAINVSLTKLSPRTREIFILSRFSGLKNKEIADQLGLTTKGIEYHIGNALKQLRNDLSKDYFVIFYCLLLSLLIKK